MGNRDENKPSFLEIGTDDLGPSTEMAEADKPQTTPNLSSNRFGGDEPTIESMQAWEPTTRRLPTTRDTTDPTKGIEFASRPAPVTFEQDLLNRRMAIAVLKGPEDGAKPGLVFPLQGVTVIGRSHDCDIVLDDQSISREHVRITPSAQLTFHLRDLDSRNGTYVNGIRIADTTLGLGDKFTIGDTVLLLSPYDRLQEELLTMQHKVSLGYLAQRIAHDFNNIAFVVKSSVEHLLDEDVSAEELRQGLLDIRSACAEASDLTKPLLNFAPQSDPKIKEVDLNPLIDEVVRFCRRSFEATFLIETQVEDKLSVTGERAQLHQVIMNLLLNARDAMPDGGLIQVTGRSLINGEVQLSVRDTGSGMPPDVAERIFEPFFTTKELGHGTGLGLANAYGIVVQHGGTIETKTTVGGGSTFVVTLRSRINAPPADRGPQTERIPPLRRTVMVVDDEPATLRALKRLLRSIGWDVVTVESGAEAVAEMTNKSAVIDAVLLDWRMPDMDGAATARALTEIAPNVPILAMSGYARSDTFKDSAVRGFLGKPIHENVLDKALKKLV